jgi:hypothetical protein
MDPLTVSLVFGAAKTAFETIKSGIAVGKEIQTMAGDVAKLYGAAAKLTQFENSNPKPSMFSGVTAEELAIDIVTKRKQAQSWMAQVKNQFVSQYGLVGWAEVERELVRIRKAQRAAERQAQKEHEELMYNLQVAGTAFVLVVFVAVGIGCVIVFFVK